MADSYPAPRDYFYKPLRQECQTPERMRAASEHF